MQLALDLGNGQPPEVETLKPRDDGGTDLATVRGAEDEGDVIGRFLECLQEDVPALLDPLDLVDDEDLAAQVRRRRVNTRQQVAHVVDLVVRGGVHLHHVEGSTIADRDAGLARVVRFAVDQVRAIQGLGQDSGHRRLAGAAGPDEQEAMRDGIRPHGVAQGDDHGLLADDLAERLCAPTAVERLMRRARCHAAHGGRAADRRHGAPGFGRRCWPCTLRRSGRFRAHHHERLGPGRSAAPDEVRLVLLPSGPDTVHESPLRGTRPSTSLEAAAFESGDLGREFSPAGADCRYRAPLVPRLARPADDSRAGRAPRLMFWSALGAACRLS